MTKSQKIIRSYLNDLRKIGPKSKDFSNYISNLSTNIEEYISQNQVQDRSEIVDVFGTPGNVLSDYFMSADNDALITTARKTHIRSLVLRIISIALLVGLIVWSVYLGLIYKQIQDESVFFEETTIRINGVIQDETESNP